MIFICLAAVLGGAPIAATIVAEHRSHTWERKERHALCLAETARLERELATLDEKLIEIELLDLPTPDCSTKKHYAAIT